MPTSSTDMQVIMSNSPDHNSGKKSAELSSRQAEPQPEKTREKSGVKVKSVQNNVLRFRITEERKVIIEVRNPDNDELLRTISLDDLPSFTSGQLIDILT